MKTARGQNDLHSQIIKVLFSFQFLTLQHRSVGGVGDGKNVWWHFMTLLSLVQVHDLLSVNRKALVRVDDDAEETGVGLHGKRKSDGRLAHTHRPPYKMKQKMSKFERQVQMWPLKLQAPSLHINDF